MLHSVFSDQTAYYNQVMLRPSTFVNIATSQKIWNEILSFHSSLATDDYVKYLDQLYRKCMDLYGEQWFYMDITNVLYTAAKLLQPKNYLEIGVRRGRSVCTVARACPTVDVYAFDMWVQSYAGMENPGPNFVASELKKHKHTGKVQFINGNSHELLPTFFPEHQGTTFDLITVDGDHSDEGAYQDLLDVLPHLSVGGILVFDDVSHPAHPHLLDIWNKAICQYKGYRSYEYTEYGYGVAFAIREE